MKNKFKTIMVIGLLSITAFGCKGKNDKSSADSATSTMGAKNGGGASGVADSSVTGKAFQADTPKNDSTKGSVVP
jgi:predicted small lipoprotein YifL